MHELDVVTGTDAEFLAALEALPGSYDGPDGVRPDPYGLTAFGEAVSLAPVLGPWIDAPLVTSGTQFLVSTGFDYGELGPLRIATEMTGAEIVTMGAEIEEADLRVESGPFSLYTFASYLGYATGHGDAVEQMDAALRVIAERCRWQAPTETNPAKTLAWTLWNRVPLLVASRANAGVPELLQRVFARVGKSLAVTVGEHPLELVSGALEGKHELGDDLLALIVGGDDAELKLVDEILRTRVAQVERLDTGQFSDLPGDPVARALIHWYYTLWTAAYLAILHGHDPADSGVYQEARKAAQGG